MHCTLVCGFLLQAVQRFLSADSVRSAQIAVYQSATVCILKNVLFGLIGVSILKNVLLGLIGVSIFAYVMYNCDL